MPYDPDPDARLRRDWDTRQPLVQHLLSAAPTLPFDLLLFLVADPHAMHLASERTEYRMDKLSPPEAD